MENLNKNELMKFYLPKINNRASQKFDCDYIMPDYEAEIMRILKFKTEAYTTNKTIANNKLTFDISVINTVVYQSYDMLVYSAKTESSYVKSVDIAEGFIPQKCEAKLSCEGVTCKATGKRRVEFSGNVLIDYTLYSEENIPISNFEENQLECKYEKVEAKLLQIISEKKLNIKEEIEENFSGVNVMETECNAVITDYRIVSDKVVIKGDIICQSFCINDELKVQTIKFSIPFGQIIDAEGVSDENKPDIDVTVQYITIETGKEEQKPVVEVSLNINCKCYKTVKTSFLTDAFSTKQKYNLNKNKFVLPCWSEFEIKRFNHEINLGKTNEEITNINFLSVKVNCFTDKNEKKIRTYAECFIMGSDSSKTAIGNEKTFDFDDEFSLEPESFKSEIIPKLNNFNYSFVVNEREEIIINLDYEIEMKTITFREYTIINSIELLEEIKPQKTKTSIIIYYASKGESVFNIAKCYNTKVKAILEENTIDSDILLSNKHLIIPLIQG